MLKGEHPQIEVAITRGENVELVESRHLCNAVICNSEGDVVASFGDKNFPTFPRSSIKMLQGVAFAESEATSRFALDEECVALACGSHSGEEKHVEKVRNWLEKIGLSEKNLECGSHAPLDKNSASMLAGCGEKPLPAHHMCSGKHCAMLSLARVQNWEVEGYCEHDHPVQQRVREICSHFFEHELTEGVRGRDGCSIPTFAVPLMVLAKGMARFGEPSSLMRAKNSQAQNSQSLEKISLAARQMFQATVAKPFFIAGSRQADTIMVEKGRGEFSVKSGAEGVYTAVIPRLKLGVALKCIDGTTRAARAAIALLLKELDLLAVSDADSFANKPLVNFRGFDVGAIRARFL